jgi:hypothetical protein
MGPTMASLPASSFLSQVSERINRGRENLARSIGHFRSDFLSPTHLYNPPSARTGFPSNPSRDRRQAAHTRGRRAADTARERRWFLVSNDAPLDLPLRHSFPLNLAHLSDTIAYSLMHQIDGHLDLAVRYWNSGEEFPRHQSTSSLRTLPPVLPRPPEPPGMNLVSQIRPWTSSSSVLCMTWPRL